jgi:hypothetical protein
MIKNLTLGGFFSQKQNNKHSDKNKYIRKIKRRPMIRGVIKVQEVHHFAQLNAVNQIAPSTR